MGYRVTAVGHIDVRPALNDEEFEYLMAFAESRRWRRSSDLWAVPSSPFGMDDEYDEVEAYNDPPAGQPGLWCPWVPACEGRCLVVRDAHDGKHYGLTRWLAYLDETFLRRGARAQGAAGFDAFTFDHELGGVVAAHRSDSGEMWLVRPRAGRVEEEVLRQGDSLAEQIAYEEG
ncbi:MAG: hypothetical protein Q8R60_07465 [Mycobacteriales bacterium]|nr:hypothetical protein [Mycobacteriales bacterium]